MRDRKSFLAVLAALIEGVVGVDGAFIQLVTRCASVDEFIERFSRFTTETDVVVPAVAHVDVGTTGQFVIRLKDQTVMMKGRCEVTEIRPVAAAPGARPGAPGPALMRLRLREMDAHSCGIHLRLMERHAASRQVPAAPAAPAPSAPAPVATSPEVAPAAPSAPSAPEGVAAEAPADEFSAVTAVGGEPVPPSEAEATAISALPRREQRVPGAALTLPANPLGDLDAADLASFIELTLLETNGTTGDGAPKGRLDRAQRIARRVAPYAACIIAGLALGIASRGGAKPSPVVAAAPPIPVEAPVAALPPPETDPMPEPEGDPIVTERTPRKRARVAMKSSRRHGFGKMRAKKRRAAQARSAGAAGAVAIR